MARKQYRRGAELVAVRHIRLSASETLDAGDPLPEGMREFHKRSLYRRRLVALEGCSWGAKQIAARVSNKVELRKTSDSQKAALESVLNFQTSPVVTEPVPIATETIPVATDTPPPASDTPPPASE